MVALSENKPKSRSNDHIQNIRIIEMAILNRGQAHQWTQIILSAHFKRKLDTKLTFLPNR